VGSSLKTLVVPKKSKGKEKFFEPRNESLEHVDFCSSSELGDGDSLLVLPLNNQGRGVGGKQVLEHPEQNKALETQMGAHESKASNLLKLNCKINNKIVGCFLDLRSSNSFMTLKQWNIRIKIELMVNPITMQLAQGIARPPLSVALGVRLF
jgi:hypothetical protein